MLKEFVEIKLNKKYSISMTGISAVLLVILATNLVMASTSNLSAINANNAQELKVVETAVEISPKIIDDIAQLEDLAPETNEEAEQSIYPVRNRFILFTGDGSHVMWGFYGNGRFVGTDNLGKRCWGIYGKDVFAGFYDGEFFFGRYANGYWKAQYLFGLENSRGEFVLFPRPTLTNDSVEP
jgi:hypothetical protein